MRRRVAGAVLSAAVGSALFVAAPVQAQPSHPCYLSGPPTWERIASCACQDVAATLSPVIPPSSWDCIQP